MLVPFTQSHTTLAKKQPGQSVNLEVDILAKYAHQSFLHMQTAATAAATKKQ